MPIPDVLRSLLTATGPSGYETAPARAFADAAAAFAEVTTDVMGSVWARVPGTGGGPTLAIVGHIDEIGLIVTHIEDTGFLRFIGVGGWDPQILIGQRVEVSTKDGPIPGVIGKKPIHVLSPEDRKKVPDLKELHLDIGAKDGDEARGMVRAGDVAVIAGDPMELPHGRAVSRSMDNRLGCYVAYEAARLVAEAGGAPGDVVAVAAVQEETTFGGSTTTAYSLRPDVALVVDVTHATDAPGVDATEIGATRSGRARSSSAARTSTRRSSRPGRGGRGGVDPLHDPGLGPAHGHRPRRLPRQPRGHPERRPRPAAALHALPGRDGRPRRHRAGRAARRGLRAAPGGRDDVRALALDALDRRQLDHAPRPVLAAVARTA